MSGRVEKYKGYDFECFYRFYRWRPRGLRWLDPVKLDRS
jgi:hypothetical protein